MTPPTPTDFAADIRDIIDTLTRGVTVGEGQPVIKGGTFTRESLDQAYQWFHGAAYAQRAGGESTSRLCPKCGGEPVVPRCDECTPRLTSDPTGDVAIREGLIDELERAGRLLRSALSDVRGAVTALQACVTVIDRGVDRTLRPTGEWVDGGELKAARAAQARRKERGEGVA